MGPVGAECNFFAFTHTDWLKVLVREDLRPFIYLCMLITFCLCRSILMSLASENSTSALSVSCSCGVTCMMFLSATAVRRISISPCSKDGPAWAASSPGHPCRAQPEGSPLLFSASLFCKWGGRAKKDAAETPGSAWLNRIHFSAFVPSSSTPITAPLRACNALIQLSLLQRSEPGHCLMRHLISGLETYVERLLRMEKLHFCDATSWNVVLLAGGRSSAKKPLVRRS